MGLKGNEPQNIDPAIKRQIEDIIKKNSGNSAIKWISKLSKLLKRLGPLKALGLILDLENQRRNILPWIMTPGLEGNPASIEEMVAFYETLDDYELPDLDSDSARNGHINIDTVAIWSFVSETSTQKEFAESCVAGKQMLLTFTALAEAKNVLSRIGGPKEKANFFCWARRVKLIPNAPHPAVMRLNETKRTGRGVKALRDKQIFGTGYTLNIVTLTSDTNFIRAAAAQGVNIKHLYILPPQSLSGQ